MDVKTTFCAITGLTNTIHAKIDIFMLGTLTTTGTTKKNMKEQ